MTVQEILYSAKALIDEYNEEGSIYPAEETSTIDTNGIQYINTALRQVYSDIKLFGEYPIVQKKIPNLLGDQFEIREFIGEPQYFPNENGVVGAKAYFFTVDDDANVKVQEYDGSVWNDLLDLTLTPTEETDYKGLISASNSDYPIRIVFDGSTFYRHMNRCLFSYPFKADAIPDYKKYLRYEMPDDFVKLHEIVQQDLNRSYNVKANYKWEGYKTFALDYDYNGTLKILYKPLPQTVTSESDVVTINNPYAINFIEFFVAAHMATTENTDLVNFLNQKADEALYRAMKPDPAGEESIKDIYYDNTLNPYIGGGTYGNI